MPRIVVPMSYGDAAAFEAAFVGIPSALGPIFGIALFLTFIIVGAFVGIILFPILALVASSNNDRESVTHYLIYWGLSILLVSGLIWFGGYCGRSNHARNISYQKQIVSQRPQPVATSTVSVARPTKQTRTRRITTAAKNDKQMVRTPSPWTNSHKTSITNSPQQPIQVDEVVGALSSQTPSQQPVQVDGILRELQPPGTILIRSGSNRQIWQNQTLNLDNFKYGQKYGQKIEFRRGDTVIARTYVSYIRPEDNLINLYIIEGTFPSIGDKIYLVNN